MYATTPSKNFSLSALEVGQEIIPDFLEFFSFGIIILDAHGRVTNLNSSAKHIIDHGEIFIVTINKSLRILDATDNYKLQNLINPMLHDEVIKKSLLIKKVKNNTQILIQASQLLNLAKKQCRGSILFIKDISHINELSIDNLKILFQLTPSEAEITHALVNGKSLNDIAKQRARCITTVRSQLKGIFIKTGTCSQQELIRLSYQSLLPVTLDS